MDLVLIADESASVEQQENLHKQPFASDTFCTSTLGKAGRSGEFRPFHESSQPLRAFRFASLEEKTRRDRHVLARKTRRDRHALSPKSATGSTRVDQGVGRVIHRQRLCVRYMMLGGDFGDSPNEFHEHDRQPKRQQLQDDIGIGDQGTDRKYRKEDEARVHPRFHER